MLPWLILVFAMVGNCGFWLFCFNRVNASGRPRRQTKVLEKLCIVCCFAIPIILLISQWGIAAHWLAGEQTWWPVNSWPISVWLSLSGLSLVLLGPWWVASRRWLRPPANLLSNHSSYFHVTDFIAGHSAHDRFTKFLDRLPGNQISQLEVNDKSLRLPRQIELAEGLRIGHISDLHFTGQLSLEHYQFVVDQLMALKPDLLAITGDLIDYDRCLPWLEQTLRRCSAPLGCYFVLGNHDRRLNDCDRLLSILNDNHFVDAGKTDHRIDTERGLEILIKGNELPWFDRKQRESDSTTDELGHNPEQRGPQQLRLGLSHSPDQIDWARGEQMDLLLAGHTHGGQARFPIIGPIVAPSRYGSQFASGVFHLAPTMMHVSRGVAGTHPLRWRCLPEVTVLTLRSSPVDSSESAVV